jgi:hypothetical protein
MNIFLNSREVYIIVDGSYPNTHVDYRSRCLSVSLYLLNVENNRLRYFWLSSRWNLWVYVLVHGIRLSSFQSYFSFKNSWNLIPVSHSSVCLPHMGLPPSLVSLYLHWRFVCIIIIGKTALFESKPSLDNCQIGSGFYLFGFRKSSALHPAPNMEDRVPVFMSPSDKVAQLYPQAPCVYIIKI